MTRHRNTHKKSLTDAKVRRKVGKSVTRPQKASHLTFAAFSLFLLVLPLCAGVHGGLIEAIFVSWAIILSVANLIWAMVAAVGWRRELPWDWRQRSSEQRCQLLRPEMIWFHTWKAGYLALVSAMLLLFSLAGLEVLKPARWGIALLIGSYPATFAISIWKRRHFLRVHVEGWSSRTWWGRLMLYLVAIGPAAGASIGSGIGIALSRSHIVPKHILLAVAGVIGVLTANMIVPFAVLDLSIAQIHREIRRTEIDQSVEVSATPPGDDEH